MKRDRKRRLDAVAAERLLDGDGGGPAYLVGLIASATARPNPSELAREDAAAAAFVAARDDAVRGAAALRRSAPRAAHGPVRARPRRGRLVPAKAAVLGVALALAAGGLALAATTGVLPSLRHVDGPLTGPAGRTGASSHPSKPAGAGVDATVSGPAGPAGSASPAPSLDGLCHAYLAQVGVDGDLKARQNPAFAALFTAAGGVEKTTAFCQARLSGATASAPGKSSPHPTGPPSPHVTGGSEHR
jgi:hypothetical protein